MLQVTHLLPRAKAPCAISLLAWLLDIPLFVAECWREVESSYRKNKLAKSGRKESKRNSDQKFLHSIHSCRTLVCGSSTISWHTEIGLWWGHSLIFLSLVSWYGLCSLSLPCIIMFCLVLYAKVVFCFYNYFHSRCRLLLCLC